MSDGRTKAAHVRAKAVVDRLGQAILSRSTIRGVEVGVHRGVMSSYLLEMVPNLHLFLVDHWKGVACGPPGYTPADQKVNYVAMQALVRRHFQRVSIIAESSKEAAELFQFASFDFVFIDANHSFNAVYEDCCLWGVTLRKGGLLCGHDYGHPDYPGVKSAVQKWLADTGRQESDVEVGPQYTWFVRV